MKDKVIKFIKSVALQEPSIKRLLTTFLSQEEAIAGKSLDTPTKEALVNSVASNLNESTYLSKYVEAFSDVFSEEDLTFLINVHAADPMVKYKNDGESLFTPFYNDMRAMVKDKVVNIS